MDPIVSLLLLHLAKNKTAAPTPKTRAPRWPTPTSPPPMPAFKSKATPSPAQAADTATPLAELHTSPPKVAPANAPARPKAAPRKVQVPRIVPGLMTSTLPVKRLQQALNARGANLKPDGLFGPKTAAAWSSLAKAKGLPGMITRKAPTLADVATHTFDALSIPAIP